MTRDSDREEAKELIDEILAVNPSLTVDQIMEIGSIAAIGEERLREIQRNVRKAGLPHPSGTAL